MNMDQDFVGVSEIKQDGSDVLCIRWSDGALSHYNVVDLRKKCPCAVCVDEMTGQRKLRPESISPTVRPIRIDSVGRYALTIRFNDGHATGIYTFNYLRSLSSGAVVSQ